MVAQYSEVLRAEAEQSRAVELCIPTNVVVDLGRELVAVLVVPELGCPVFPADEYRGGIPVVALARQVVAAFKDQDLLAGGRKPVSEGPSTRTRADNDHIPFPLTDHGTLLPHGRPINNHLADMRLPASPTMGDPGVEPRS